MKIEDRLLKAPPMRNINTLMPPIEPDDTPLVVAELLSFQHDSIPEHTFDETEFFIRPSETVDYIPL